MYIITWLPNQTSDFHNHPKNGCLMKILSGNLKEIRLDIDKNQKINILKKNDIIFIESTVFPGVTEQCKNYLEKKTNLKNNKEIGIVVIDENIMEGLDKHQKIEVEDSVDPVFIPVSTKVEQDSLKRLIKKSIGVDLWK